MGEAKRRAEATPGLNLPFILPVDALRPEFFDDPRFMGRPMAHLFGSIARFLEGGSPQSDSIYLQSIDTPTGPLRVVLIYPDPVAPARPTNPEGANHG